MAVVDGGIVEMEKTEIHDFSEDGNGYERHGIVLYLPKNLVPDNV